MLGLLPIIYGQFFWFELEEHHVSYRVYFLHLSNCPGLDLGWQRSKNRRKTKWIIHAYGKPYCIDGCVSEKQNMLEKKMKENLRRGEGKKKVGWNKNVEREGDKIEIGRVKEKNPGFSSRKRLSERDDF